MAKKKDRRGAPTTTCQCGATMHLLRKKCPECGETNPRYLETYSHRQHVISPDIFSSPDSYFRLLAQAATEFVEAAGGVELAIKFLDANASFFPPSDVEDTGQAEGETVSGETQSGTSSPPQPQPDCGRSSPPTR